MVVVFKVFNGKDSAKKAVNLICNGFKQDLKMDFEILADKATRRRDEKTEKEFLEVVKC